MPSAMENQNWMVGESVVMQTEMNNLQSDFYILNPDQEEIFMQPQIKGNKGIFVLRSPDRPGVYTLYENGIPLRMDAVNIDPRESDFSAISEEGLQEYIKHASVHYIDENKSIDHSIASVRWGKEFWKEILTIGLFILIIEMVVGRSWKKLRK